MSEPTRRGAIGIWTGLGSAAAIGMIPAAAFAQSQIDIPARAMRLSRRLDRSLHGGATLSVSRSWRVEFSRRMVGRAPEIAISGVQIDAEVNAPEALEPLAALERSRSTDAMWPITLSDAGRIVTAGSGLQLGADSGHITAAIAAAQEMIAARPIPASQREAQDQYLRDMQNAGASFLNRFPKDLFFPLEQPQQSLREIELPSGLKGQFEITYDARSAALGDWLQHAERKVVTRIGESEQRSSERWFLTEF